MGRLYYAWLGEDYKTVKFLLREGEGAWSENREAVIKQVLEHETFISLTEVKRDPTFVIAEFGLLTDLSWIDRIPEEDDSYRLVGQILDLKSKAAMQTIQRAMSKIEQAAEFFEEVPLTRDPFDIFDRELKFIAQLQEQGIDTPAVAEVKEILKNALDKSNDDPDATGPIIVKL